MDEIEPLQIAHSQQHFLARHVGQYRRPHAVGRQAAQVDAVEPGAPDSYVAVRRLGYLRHTQGHPEPLRYLERECNVRSARVDEKDHRLTVDPAAGHIVPGPVAAQDHLGTALYVLDRLGIPVRVLPITEQALEEQGKHGQADHPGREQHDPAEP